MMANKASLYEAPHFLYAMKTLLNEKEKKSDLRETIDPGSHQAPGPLF